MMARLGQKWCSCIEWESMRDKHYKVVAFLSGFFPPINGDTISTDYSDCPFCGSILEDV